MKARKNTPRAIALYYPSGALNSPEAKVMRADGVEICVLNLSPVGESSNLYMSDVVVPVAPKLATVLFNGSQTNPETPNGVYTVQYSHLVDEVRTVIVTHTLEVGDSPVSDFALSQINKPKFYLSDEEVGDNSSTVTLKILDGKGKTVNSGVATLPKYTGDAAITTIALSDAALASQENHLVFRINSDDVADNKAVAFKAANVSKTGDAATFSGADATTTATYEMNGSGVVRAITLDGVADGVDSYAVALNSAISGASVSVNAGQLVITSDRKGSSAAITITPGSEVGNNWVAKVGLSGTVTADAALNNVADADAVTTAEIMNRIESDVMVTLVGDILDTSISDDSKLNLVVKVGTAGSSSKLELISGDVGLKASLGLSGLTLVLGLDAGTVECPFVATDSMYVATPQPISKEDNYTLIWYDDGVITKVEQKLGLIATGVNIGVSL